MSDKISISPRQQAVLGVISPNEWYSASDLSVYFADISSATLRRELGDLVKNGLLLRRGENKGVEYSRTEQSSLFIPYELGAYYLQDEDKRHAQTTFNFDIFQTMQSASLFTYDQCGDLTTATDKFHQNAKDMSDVLRRKELERFVIEFSWKSSKIEGNTYSLLDTEFLLKNGIEAQGKSKYETAMIINHKNAYLFVVEAIKNNITFDTAFIEKVHGLVVDNLGIEHGVRDRIVGISGSLYTPLAMKQQLKEQLGVLAEVIRNKDNVYEKALMAVLGISYLQPFEDGNKRTARVLANALLLSAGCAPLSYRSVDEREYKEATLIFYEQNSVVPFRELFVEQYAYSATHYNIAE